jgi:hypothetical protein
MVNNGSFGIFICDSANPFDASVLANPQDGVRWGAAIKFTADDVGDPIVTDSTTNGWLGRPLENTWPSGFGAIVELESLTMSQGIAEIFLKQVNEPLP